QQCAQLRKFALASLIENAFVCSFLEMNGKSGFLGITYPELTLFSQCCLWLDRLQPPTEEAIHRARPPLTAFCLTRTHVN
ncbi:MAG: hypothetical protein WBA43_23350, partial [Elainellaceae cyanobacterium]